MNEYQRQTLELYRSLYGLAEQDLYRDPERSEAEVVLAAVADYHTDRPHAFDIDPGASALVVIDMQAGFVRRSSPQWIPQAERIVPRLDEVAEAARQRGIPVVFTSAQFLDPSPTDALRMTAAIAEGNLGAGTEQLEILPELWREGDLLIGTKHTYDAFWQTDLDYILRGLRKDTLVIAGTLTNFCCEATARAGFDRGYHVVLCSDLCASDNPWTHDATLQTMRRGYGRVVDSSAVLDAWQA
ncbi:isochorismatase family cysteine hydrolase [Micropruina sp.]|uniref:cysteine hydrolase family protein n=1 Tax=Micropruina sp. TaxID=2737536 RepID=UPI00262CECFA|nr:isochorismatase family cysteine hydrolase [Micropruina sp.]